MTKETVWIRWQQWLNRHLTVKQDWVFYSLAFIPFFIISFAVWICLDEAIFALRYRVVIQWSLFPYFRAFADLWHYIGIILFVIGLVIMGFALILRRRPVHPSVIHREQVQWYQFIRIFRHWLRESRMLVIIATLGMLSLIIALASMRIAFVSQFSCSIGGPGIPCFTNLFGFIIIETLFLHQLGDVAVAVGLALIFIVIIRERSED